MLFHRFILWFARLGRLFGDNRRRVVLIIIELQRAFMPPRYRCSEVRVYKSGSAAVLRDHDDRVCFVLRIQFHRLDHLLVCKLRSVEPETLHHGTPPGSFNSLSLLASLRLTFLHPSSQRVSTTAIATPTASHKFLENRETSVIDNSIIWLAEQRTYESPRRGKKGREGEGTIPELRGAASW